MMITDNISSRIPQNVTLSNVNDWLKADMKSM
jgi:hypothetical protein